MMLVDMVCCGLMWCDMMDRIELKLLCLKQPFVLLRKMWTLTFAFEKRDYQTPPAHVPETFGGLVIGQTKMIEFLNAQRGAEQMGLRGRGQGREGSTPPPFSLSYL